jgi:hypothetical protein
VLHDENAGASARSFIARNSRRGRPVPVANAFALRGLTIGPHHHRARRGPPLVRRGHDLVGRWYGAGAGVVGHVSGLKSVVRRGLAVIRSAQQNTAAAVEAGRACASDLTADRSSASIVSLRLTRSLWLQASRGSAL